MSVNFSLFKNVTILLLKASAIEMKSYGRGLAEECVVKIWEAGKGLTGFAFMMTHHLNTRR